MVFGVAAPACIAGLPFLYAAGMGGIAGLSDALRKYLANKEQTAQPVKVEVEAEAPKKGKLRIVASSGSLASMASTTASDTSDTDEPLSPTLSDGSDAFSS